MSNLTLRIITAVVLVILVLVLILFANSNQIYSALLILIGIGAWEWGKLSSVKQTSLHISFIVLTLATMFVLIYLLSSNSSPLFLFGISIAIAIFWLFAIALILRWQYGPKNEWLSGIAPRLILGWLVLSFFGWSLVYLIEKDARDLILWIIAMVCLVDIGAFITGKMVGKHAFMFKISPKKTWQGVSGGVIFTVIGALLSVTMLDDIEFGFATSIILAIIIAITAIFGDLLESLIKRIAGVKDSGNILPGHGGVLDRIDSMSASMPCVVATLIWLNHFG